MPDTFFTNSPHWGIYILLYFFVGGIAGGCLFLAGLLHLFGAPPDRPTIRTGYLAAFVGAILSGLLLTLDLTKPLRFWHMLIASTTGDPMFKAWSPMSLGAWALVLIGLVATLGTIGNHYAPLARGIIGKAIALLAIPLGLFLAGYTGVLVAVTNRPIWADSTWLGAVFLLSGVSAGAAALLLLSRRSQASSRAWLLGFDRWVLVLELVALVVFLVSLGPVARVWIGWNGVLLVGGVVGAGILAPLWLHRTVSRPPLLQSSRLPVLVLFGSFLLRLAILASSAQIHAVGSGVAGR